MTFRTRSHRPVAGAALALSVLAVLLFATSTLVLAVRARGGVEAPRAEARPA